MIPLPDLLLVLLLALAGAAVVGVVGGLALLLLRRRPLRWLLGGLAAVTVTSVVVGVLLVTRAMFISPHDAAVTMVVVAVAGVAAWVVAMVLGRLVVRGAQQLAGSARTLSGSGFAAPTAPLAAELRLVADEMASADERLREARAREAALELSRRELVAWVSHDLRSPLAGIRAMAEALEDGVVHDAPDVTRYHAGIRREADRLTGMVGDLFELSRIHAGALRLVVGAVAVDELVSDVVASADPVARSKGVRLEGTAVGGRATLDAAEMGRVLLNLVTNAIRHTPSDGAVHVSGEVVDGHARFVVADSCGGIPADDLERVFDVAFRGEAARTPSADAATGTGAGLGLAIARGIVEAHHGLIAVENAGAGCRFEVRIPVGA